MVRVAVVLAVSFALGGCAVGVADYPTYVSSTQATVSGTGFSNLASGASGTLQFQYGTTTAYGQVSPTTGFTHNGDVVAETLTGLTPGTTYHVRLCGWDRENGGAPGCAGDRTFTTPATSGPHVTMNPWCSTSTGQRIYGGEMTGTGYPRSAPSASGPLIGQDFTGDGRSLGHGWTRTEDGRIQGGAGSPTPVHVLVVRTWLDADGDGLLDPGESLLDQASLQDPCGGPAGAAERRLARAKAAARR